MYNLWRIHGDLPMNRKNNDQICDSSLFLQNALVEYIGVYSDTNQTAE